MTQGVMEQTSTAKAGSTSTERYVYFFGGGKADGNGKMKDVLGGKGAGLAEMTNAGLPVPPGFTIQTEACREYMRGKLSPQIDSEMLAALEKLEKMQGQKLGAGENPLLVSVRSGAKFSMPGMMDTILNLGLNDQAVEALAKLSNNPRFAYDSYRRLIQMFGDVVLDVPKKKFEHIFDGVKAAEKVKFDYVLQPDALKKIIAEYKKLVKKETGKDFPQEPLDQLVQARDAVFRSWQNERAKTYRRINRIDDWLGTAVNVQCMVFGNLGDNSGTGVGFTRNPATGEHTFFGEYLMNAQGEDVVSGVRTPLSISELDKAMPAVYEQLRDITSRLEKHYRDMQDFEFTIQDGKLYMLQTRNGKRTPLPQRLAHRRGVIPPKLLAFEGVIERNRVDKEVRRWLRAELPGHHLSAKVFSEDVLDEAVRRLMVYGDKPADALVLSAAFCIMPYRSAAFADLRASAATASAPHIKYPA